MPMSKMDLAFMQSSRVDKVTMLQNFSKLFTTDQLIKLILTSANLLIAFNCSKPITIQTDTLLADQSIIGFTVV